MGSFYKRNSVPIISMVIVLAFLLMFMMIIGIEPFGKYSFVANDCLHGTYPFLKLLNRKINTGDGLFYYWNGVLGDGFLPSYFYMVGSPLYLLVAFVQKNQIRSFINFTIVYRVVFSAGAFGYYISRKNKDAVNKSYMIPLSCAYALSGYIIGYYNECLFLDAYALFPIIMFGYERMIKDKKPAVYILSLVLSAYCNFFMVYMIGIFLVLWFLFDDHNNIKQFFRDLIRFAISSILAVGMSAFCILITFFALMYTRVSSSDVIYHEWFGNVFNLIKNMFFLAKPIMINYGNNCANMYAGTFVVVLFFVYFISKNINISEKLRKGALILILFLSMNESILSYVWQGFHHQMGVPNRFSFLLIFIILSISADVFEIDDSPVRCCIGLALAEILPMVTYFFVDLDSLYDEHIVLPIILVLIIIYGALFLLYILKKNKRVLLLLSFLMVAELCVHSFAALKITLYKFDDYDLSYNSYEKYKDQLADSDELYRSKFIGEINSNDNMMMDLKGVSVFNSFLNNKTRGFLKSVGYVTGDNMVEERGSFYPVMDDLLGIREVSSKNDKFLKHTDYSEQYTDENISIYKNEDALSLGFTIDRTDSDVFLNNYNCFDNINQFLGAISGYNDVVEEIYPAYSLSGEGFQIMNGDVDNLYLFCYPIEDADSKFIKATFTADRAGIYNMSMMYQDYCNALVMVNEEPRVFEYIQGGTVLAIGNVEEGDTVDIYVEPVSMATQGLQSLTEQTLDIHMSIVNEDSYGSFLEKVRRNQMDLRYITADHLKGTVDMGDNQSLLLTIPYDKGWHIYENGKEIEKQSFADTFMMLNLDKGHHELEFKFVPEGFYISLAITLVSWLIFVCWILFLKAKYKDGSLTEAVEEKSENIVNETKVEDENIKDEKTNDMDTKVEQE